MQVGERVKIRFDPAGQSAALADEDNMHTAFLALKVAGALLFTASLWYWQSGRKC